MRLFGLYALIAVAAAGYSGYWFFLADQAEAAIEAQVAAWHDDGLAVSYDESRVYGYPYRLSSEFIGFAFDQSGDAAWRWRGEQLTIHGQPWNLGHYIAVLDGTNHIDWESPVGAVRLVSEAESARASLLLDDRNQARQASIETTALTVRTDEETASVSVDLAQIHARRPEADPTALEAALLLEGITLPDGAGGALGDEIRHLSFDGGASGPVPDQFDTASLVAWRDNGGVIDTRALTIDWGPLHIDTAGALSLDEHLRPQGAFTARIVGHDVLIKILRDNGTISKNVAKALRFTFALLTVRPDDGGPPVLTVPITIQDGWLSAGPIPVLQVAPVALPPASG
jgi:hypothetical protein